MKEAVWKSFGIVYTKLDYARKNQKLNYKDLYMREV